jgi:integration host factor subunit beta
LDEIIKAIAKGESVQIRGFGSFKNRLLKTRIGRNPKDGSRIKIPAKQSVHWKISKELFQKLNQDTNRDE